MKLFVLLVLSATALAQTTKQDQEYITKTLYPATTLLYSQDDSGGMKMRCTATSIEKNATGYVMVTASHCGCQEDTFDHTVSPEKLSLFVTADEKNTKTFIAAKLIGCGYRHRGDDFALLQVDTHKVFPVIPLGHDPVELERVVNVASPLGLGKQIFLGSVSSASVDRELIDEDINWTGVVMIQMFGVDGGSSGSSIICFDQKAICGLIVGGIDKTSVTAMPVSRLISFKQKIASGTYKNWEPDPDSALVRTTSKK